MPMDALVVRGKIKEIIKGFGFSNHNVGISFKKAEGSGPDIARSPLSLIGSWTISSHGAGRVNEVYGS